MAVAAPDPIGEPRSSLGVRLVLATIGFCFVFTLLTVGVRTWSAWERNVEAMRSELRLLEQVFERTLSKAIWEMDRELLQAQVVSIGQVASVGRVVLEMNSAARAPEVMERSREGWSASTLAPSLPITLSYEPYPGGRETLGVLKLFGDERVLWSRLRDEAVAILLTQLIQSVLLAGLITLMFNRSVTVHVQRIARHVAQLTPANLGQMLALDRTPGRDDELGLLVSGVNQLQRSLSDYLARQHEYEQELSGHRDRLAELVRERTAELEALNEQLVGLSRSDPLTGLANRRHFDEVKELEFRRATRTGQPLSVLLCDVDYFKRYNDHYGHAQGDRCLRAVADALRRSVGRAGDLVARIGGEEFAVLLPATGEAIAAELAEVVRVAVASMQIPHEGSLVRPYVTLSLGVACLSGGNVPSFDALLQLADQALYRAKAAGRDRVSPAAPLSPASATHPSPAQTPTDA